MLSIRRPRRVELRKKRQSQRVKARHLTKGPAAQSVAANFCNKIGAKRTFVKTPSSPKCHEETCVGLFARRLAITVGQRRVVRRAV
jgi:hypothetical protein